MLVSMMYHYIHADGDDSIFKGLHGISSNEFEQQLAFLCTHFAPVSHEDLLACARNQRALPDRGFTLTFDDGFKQHYHNAYPLLRKSGLQGSFFIPTKPLADKRLHTLEKQRLCQYGLFEEYADFLHAFYKRASDEITKEKHSLLAPTQSNINATSNYIRQHTFYSNEERFYRFVRDEVLTEDEFENIIDKLFYAHFNEPELIDRYYMNAEEIAELSGNGMNIGGHSHSHPHLEKLDSAAANDEIALGRDLLQNMTGRTIHSFSYPFGTYNEQTIAQLKELNIHYAYTTKNHICEHTQNLYEITRVDAANFDLVRASIVNREYQATNQEGLC